MQQKAAPKISEKSSSETSRTAGPSIDPRGKNTWFNAQSPHSYLAEYATALAYALESVDSDSLDRATQAIQKCARDGRRIFVCGNGGSAAIADHLCCDCTKGTFVQGLPPIRTQSLNANVSLLTAIANDFGYEQSFAFQLKAQAEAGDIFIAISSSGQSDNILNALSTAKNQGLTTISLTGFSGGKAQEMADIGLHVNASNYGVVEDAHQALMHVLSQYITVQREGTRDHLQERP